MTISRHLGFSTLLISAVLAQAAPQETTVPLPPPPPPTIPPPPAVLPEIPPVPAGDHYLVKGAIRGYPHRVLTLAEANGGKTECFIHAGSYVCAMAGLQGRTMTPLDFKLTVEPPLKYSPTTLTFDCGPQNRCASGSMITGPTLRATGRASRFIHTAWMMLECAERLLPELRPFALTHDDIQNGTVMMGRSYPNGWSVGVAGPNNWPVETAGPAPGHVYLSLPDTPGWILLGEIQTINREYCHDW
ncbi:hypothetical protein [Chitinimonas lacunae]|uniref:Uncharacterized protein n=1 Tax=Chitinimonas lacunae TaxID=1963018 RepID=A0ABV8MSZ5_9NEIS